MRLAYGDLIGGISGDMFVAALIDLGLPLRQLKSELRKLPALKFDLKAGKKTVHSIRATRFQVVCPSNDRPRTWQEIRRLIERSKLHSETKAIGLKIFTGLAQAEAKIHNVDVGNVHFHEVGATDSIVDIMAAAIGAHELKITALKFSPIPLGRGITRSMHGLLPVPGPATLELLKGLPVVGVNIQGETVTPTGAAIVRALGQSFGDLPSMNIEKIGYGAGQKEFADRPNLFRLVIGASSARLTHDEMLILETNIDDMNPQYFDHMMDRLFSAGARDVFLTPVQMKKNRPATLLTVLCEPPHLDPLAKIILQESTTIGLRYYPVSRLLLNRETKKVKTRFGEITVKIIEQPDGSKRAMPEYEDLKRIATVKKLPIKLIHDEVARRLDS
ncbi:MAG TPA: nickel pincer cofactor biosynthesis protein LarC [Acidobacteriota bacterium]|nr:nickel pincer cofactor biosynthesis protein LarC [Acidobacteriota bacterium]